MKCTNCQNEIQEGSSRCNYCGQEVKSQPVIAQQPKKKNKWVSLIVIVIFVGMGIYNGIQNKGAEKNDQGIKTLDTGGDYQIAINSFEEAYTKVVNNEDKITILKNIGYAYWMNYELDKSLEKFKQALTMADKNSADFYLISGEIALLEEDPSSAEQYYLQALAKSPEDFQINTSLGVFYLGIDEVTQDYVDYEKALQYNKKAYEIMPDSETTRENVANSYFYVGQYEQAIELFKQTTLKNKPFNNYMIGLSYYALNDDANARKYLQTAVDMGYEPEPEAVEFLATQSD